MVNQVVIQAATVVMMALRDTEAGPWLATVVSRELQRQRHSEPVLVKLAFNWGMHDRCVEPMNFKMDVSYILETKTYEYPNRLLTLAWFMLKLLQDAETKQ